MLLGKAIDDLAERTKTKEDTKRDYLRQKFNFSVAAYWRSHHWDFRYKTSQIPLVANVTGTCTVTDFTGTNEGASRIVTISTPTISSAWIGRYFKVDDEDEWHRIVGVDTVNTKLTLESPILVAGGSFTIWKRIYNLCSDCDTMISIYGFNGSKEFEFRPMPKLIGDYSNLSAESTPQKFGNYGVDNFQDVEYTAGTISGTANTDVVTGSGTLFIENVTVGDILIAGDYEYTIKRVETDIKIVLYTKIVDAIAAVSAYRIKKNEPRQISLYPSTDQHRVLTYYYWSKPYSFFNYDNDFLPFNVNEVDLILKRAEGEVMSDKDLINNATLAFNMFDARLTKMKSSNKSVHSRASKFEPLIDMGLPGRDY